eukprot:GEZU01001854.1.p2 GENE.GEZU01001854.1~~GEZU01001854.1.p2  ORF type:complete len:108 (-),score=46.50 GEZU01001854.1:126-449(-)
MSVEEQFKLAVLYVNSGFAKEQFPDKPELSQDQKLAFYAYYKQATIGKCNTERPGMFDFVGKAKWDAWNKLGDMSKEEAMQKYIDLLNDLAPGWESYPALKEAAAKQ